MTWPDAAQWVSQHLLNSESYAYDSNKWKFIYSFSSHLTQCKVFYFNSNIMISNYLYGNGLKIYYLSYNILESILNSKHLYSIWKIIYSLKVHCNLHLPTTPSDVRFAFYWNLSCEFMHKRNNMVLKALPNLVTSVILIRFISVSSTLPLLKFMCVFKIS